MEPVTYVGQGTYGKVFRKGNGLAMKQVAMFEHNRANFELTSICEIATLAISGIPNTPVLCEVMSDNHSYYITMEDCGKTLLEYARTISTSKRQQFAPKVMFNLLESAIALEELGLLHNDIKSSNVMVNHNGDIKLIDFGINMFELAGKVDKHLMSKPQTDYPEQWGTYCICPPETFLDNTWTADKYMVWSIGITICEFIFKTHSFICDCLLPRESKDAYQRAYNNDSRIRYFMKMMFMNKIMSGDKTLSNFTTCTNLQPEIADLISRALIIDYKERASLRDLYNLPIFDQFRIQKQDQKIGIRVIKDKTAIYGAPVEAPMLHTRSGSGNYYVYRKLLIEWMFDVYNATHKLQLLVHAVSLFDRYMAVEPVVTEDIVVVACSAAYLAQYMIKHEFIDLQNLITSLSLLSPQVPSHCIQKTDVINCINHMFRRLHYKLYRKTFDVLICKEGIAVDFDIITETLFTVIPPYNNSKLINTYISLVKKYEKLVEIAVHSDVQPEMKCKLMRKSH